MSNDRELLAEYRRCSSESAFGELVNKHLRLVYSTAMRLVNGDSHAAEDIAQRVFTKLARKATDLPSSVVLSGWLHRDTKLTALEWLRAEKRRTERERKAATMEDFSTIYDEIEWEQVRPILDEILDKLRPEDRDALLLRFFEQQSFSAVGATLGIGEDAARKRVSRALDKLRIQLGTHGVTTSATALSLALAVHGSQNIPPGLAGQITRSAVATLGATAVPTAGVFGAMASVKTGIALAAASALVVSAIVVRHQSVPDERVSLRETVDTKSISYDQLEASATRRLLGMQIRKNMEGNPKHGEIGLEAALDWLRKALYSKTPSREHPDADVVAAILSTGEHREIAYPVLHGAMNDASEEVRIRAAEVFPMLGSAGQWAVPDLIAALHAKYSPPAFSVYIATLEKVGKSADLLPNLVELLRSTPNVRLDVANNLSRPIWGAPERVASAMRPLLADPDPSLQLIAAYSIAILTRDHPGEEVIAAAVRGLKSTDESLQNLALTTLRNIGSHPSDPLCKVRADRLPPSASEAIPFLMKISHNATNTDERESAAIILSALVPNYQDSNPRSIGELERKKQLDAYRVTIGSGEAGLADLVAGLRSYPDAVSESARALGKLGPAAGSALPLLRELLATAIATASAPNASSPGLLTAIRNRDSLANAIQRISRDQPKAYFTSFDIQSTLRQLDLLSNRADPETARRVRTAIQPILPINSDVPLGLNPEQMGQLLSAIEAVDGTFYEAMTAHVARLDPNFPFRRSP